MRQCALWLVLPALLLASPTLRAEEAPGSDKTVTPAGANADTKAPGYLRQVGPKPARTEDGIGSARKEDSASGIRVTLALLVLGGLGATALYLRKKRGKVERPVEALTMRAVSQVALGNKASATLLSIGSEALLLGVTENGVTLLRSFTREELSLLPEETQAPSEPKTKAPKPAKSPSPSAQQTQGARLAFRDILENAAQTEAARRAESARLYAESLQRETALDEEAPPDSGPRHREEDEDEDAVPAHLAVAISEMDKVFGQPEGQAAELMRRFRERR